MPLQLGALADRRARGLPRLGNAVQADCICIVYLRGPVCVIEGGGASSTPCRKRLKARLVSKLQTNGERRRLSI